MAINPFGVNNYGWNYSKPDKPGYSTQLVGTVLAIQEVQKMGYTMTGQPGAPEFWPDGNPKMNIRLALATEQGEIKTFTFQPAGKKARMGEKKSVHMDLFHLTGDTDMMNLIGKTICIQTQEGYYGQGHPRPWFVSLVDAGPFVPANGLPSEFKAPQVLANSAASGGQVNAPQPQPQPQPAYQQYQPQQQGYQQYQQYQQQRPAYQPQPVPQAQPAYQQYQPQPQPQPTYQQQGYQPQSQPTYQQQGYQQQAQPMYQQQPQEAPIGMDPTIMQAMATEVFGDGVTVEMVQPEQPAAPVGSGEVYDEDMPF